MTISSTRIPLTEGGNIPNINLAASHPGMAHFAGTGPLGQTCLNCSHHHNKARRGDGSSQGRCKENERLSTNRGARPAKYPSRAPACKYFKGG